MPIDDKLFDLMDRVGSQWAGYEIPEEPRCKLKYLGIARKDLFYAEVPCQNGQAMDWDDERLTDVANKESRLFVDARVGTEIGVARFLLCVEASPNYESRKGWRPGILRDLEFVLNREIGHAVQQAYRLYKQKEGEAATKKGYIFERLTHSVPVEDIGRFRSRKFSIKEMRRRGMKLSALLNSDPSIINSSVKLRGYLVWNRQVIIQPPCKRRIRNSSEYYFQIRPKMTILNPSHELIHTYDRQFFTIFDDMKDPKVDGRMREYRDMSLAASKGISIVDDEYPIFCDIIPSDTILHELVVHHLSAPAFFGDFLAWGLKNYGGQIGPKELTLRVTPFVQGSAANMRYDFEGMPTQEFVLMENGRLVNYICDHNGASWIAKKLREEGKKSIHRIVPGYARMEEWGVGDTEVPKGYVYYNDCFSNARATNVIADWDGYREREEEQKRHFIDLIRQNPRKKGFHMKGYAFGDSEGDYIKVEFQFPYQVDEQGNEVACKAVSLDGNPISIIKNIVGMGRDKENSQGLCGDPDSSYITTNVRTGKLLIDRVPLKTVTGEQIAPPYRI